MTKTKQILEQSADEFAETVRRAERDRIADLLDDGAETIGRLCHDGECALRVAALMLRGPA